jgi:hypothetical protein
MAEIFSGSPPVQGAKFGRTAQKRDISHVESIGSSVESSRDHMNHDRVDKELAKYADAARIEISEADNKRLKHMIDRRVLAVMVFTYFLQALDKGTLSFASIMNIRKDTHLVGQQVSTRSIC